MLQFTLHSGFVFTQGLNTRGINRKKLLQSFPVNYIYKCINTVTFKGISASEMEYDIGLPHYSRLQVLTADQYLQAQTTTLDKNDELSYCNSSRAPIC